jgi:hypothetical protein
MTIQCKEAKGNMTEARYIVMQYMEQCNRNFRNKYLQAYKYGFFTYSEDYNDTEKLKKNKHKKTSKSKGLI